MKTDLSNSRGVYASLTNDYMFKKIFGCEESKDILLTFLNHIIGNGDILDVSFLNTENLGPTSEDRKVIFDIAVRTNYCEEYRIEMQLAKQDFFRDRALFYSCYPVINQGELAKQKYIQEHGSSAGFKWNFRLNPVRLIAIVDFTMEHAPEWDASRYHSSYRLHEDSTGELLHDKLQYVFLELGRFNKSEDELDGYYDKWMYLFKNMSNLESRPETFKEKIFDSLFTKADFANFTPQEFRKYQEATKMISDYENCIDYARKEGREEGRKEGREEGREEGAAAKAIETAKNLKAKGIDSNTIAECTGLTAEQVAEL